MKPTMAKVLKVANPAPVGSPPALVRQGRESQDNPEAGDAFSRALAYGDFDGDGYEDLASAAPFETTGGQVIGEHGILRDKPGFEVQFITRGSATEAKQTYERPSVLMPVKGHWTVTWDGGKATLAPGDTMSVPENLAHSVVPSMTGEAAIYQITGTGDPAGLTWTG